MKGYLFVLLGLLLLLPVMLPAQPDPNAPQPAGRQPGPPPQGQPMVMGPMMFNTRNAVVEITPNGLFLLANGALARYSADLEQCVTLPLLGTQQPIPMVNGDDRGGQQPMPLVNGDDRGARQKWLQDQLTRQTPPAMLAAGDQLYIVLGGTFYRINQQTLKIEAKKPIEQENPNDGPMRFMMQQPPMLKLQDNNLYVIRATDILQLNTQTGETLKKALLPKELQPQGMPQMQMGGQPGAVEGGNQPVQPVTLVGVIGARKDGDRTIWTLKTAEGDLYLLTGELKPLLGNNIQPEGKQVRITGRPEMRPQLPQGIKGVIQVQQVQVL